MRFWIPSGNSGYVFSHTRAGKSERSATTHEHAHASALTHARARTRTLTPFFGTVFTFNLIRKRLTAQDDATALASRAGGGAGAQSALHYFLGVGLRLLALALL